MNLELKINLSFDQLLYFVQQLPSTEKRKLIDIVQEEFLPKPKKKFNPLQELLLAGPTWGEQEHQEYLFARKQLNQVGTNVIT